MNPFDSTAFWTAVIASITAIGGFLAQRIPRHNAKAEAESTLGHGWSEFADALRAEAAEERELRRVVEGDSADCKRRVRALEAKCAEFERELQRLQDGRTDGPV